MVPAAVAVERGARFERVDHEAVARARGDEGSALGAGASGGGIGHLLFWVRGGGDVSLWGGNTWVQTLEGGWECCCWSWSGIPAMMVGSPGGNAAEFEEGREERVVVQLVTKERTLRRRSW